MKNKNKDVLRIDVYLKYMHRFTTKFNRYEYRRFPVRMLYLVCPVILVLFWVMIHSVDQSTLDRQQDSLQNAIDRDIIHCYAVEGFYPPSLSYMEEHYGLTYDKDLFFVDYQPVGSNMRPEVTIILK